MFSVLGAHCSPTGTASSVLLLTVSVLQLHSDQLRDVRFEVARTMSFFPRRPRDASSHRQRGSSDSPDSLVCAAAAADGEKPEVEEEEEDGAAVEAAGRCL